MQVGICGAGNMACCHMYAMDALRHYYPDSLAVNYYAVLSTGERAAAFQRKYEFDRLLPEVEFWSSGLDAVFICSPNRFHLQHLRQAIENGVSRIYIEKPICCGKEELQELIVLRQTVKDNEIVVQAGFQFLQNSNFRSALRFVHGGGIGEVITFRGEYLHSGYLDQEYRQKRIWRLQPGPTGGTMVDLGGHVVSGLAVLLNDTLIPGMAWKSGHFEGVPETCDLDTQCVLTSQTSNVTGTLRVSRISAGNGDVLRFILDGTQGAMVVSSEDSDSFLRADTDGTWNRIRAVKTSSETEFPHGSVSPGWLRSLVHAHACFWNTSVGNDLIPDLDHAISVQRTTNEVLQLLDNHKRVRGQ